MNNEIKKRTIMIFPEFENMSTIDGIRDRFDPLSRHVRPHITLAFTFDSDLGTQELKDHIEKSTADIKPFEIIMDNIVKVDNPLGQYLFLLLKDGEDDIKKLSSKLYTGIMEAYKPGWLSDETFLPHMTIGSFTSSEELEKAYQEVGTNQETFTTVVNKVSVEIIDENDDSIIDIEVNLSK